MDKKEVDLDLQPKNEYIKIVEVRHKPITYVILSLILVIIIGIIIVEIIYYGGNL